MNRYSTYISPIIFLIFLVSGASNVYAQFQPDTLIKVTNFEYAYPFWSPDGSQIVFASSRDGDFEIFIMDADGSNQQKLTDNNIEDFASPGAWSPDGDKIAFSSERDGDSEIYIMNSDGSGVTQITDNSAQDIYPSWTPDGDEVVFSSERDGQREVYKVNEDGSGSPTNLSSNNARESFPFSSRVE